MAFGRAKTDVEVGIDVGRMQQYRRARARECLKKKKMSGVLAFNPDNLRYLTVGPSDAWVREVGNRFTLFPVSGESIIFDSGMMERAFHMENPDVDFRPLIPILGWYLNGLTILPAAVEAQTRKWIDQVSAAIKEKGLKGERLGIDHNIPDSFKEGLKKETGCELTFDAVPALMEARAIKNQDEVECLRMTASIVEGCFSKMKQVIRPGCTEDDIEAAIHHEAFRLGAEALTCHVATGRHTWPNRCWHGDHLVRPGDLVFADVYNLGYLGYRSCYYRTFVCGEPTKEQIVAYNKVRDMLAAAFAIIKPGVTTGEIAKLWPKAYEFGHVDEDAAVMMQWGHGIGLGLYEPPYISRIWSVDFPEALEAGMTFALETIASDNVPSVEQPLGQAVRLEEMIHVTEKGVDRLTRWPINEITVCPL